MMEQDEERRSVGDTDSEHSNKMQLQDKRETTTTELRHTGNDVGLEGQELLLEQGPFEKHTLIKNLMPDLEYSCFEAYDENIYLGTRTGDLLHYFEIERHNYMLVSRTKFDDECTKPIKEIILLPKIERALVLCDGVLVVFLLPEFAPAPNTTKLRGILDVTLRNYSSQFKYYKFYVVKADTINLLKISSQKIGNAQKFDFKLVDKICAIDYMLMTSRLNGYALINLRDSTSIPLFPVSETRAPLKPIITKFSDCEFLVATGGGSEDDDSIAFIVNFAGKVSQGTIVLSRYPQNVVVEYPYVVVHSNSTEIEVFRLLPNDEPKMIQKMSVNGESNLRLCRTYKVFNNFVNIETKRKVIERLRSIPLYGECHKSRIEGESTRVDKSFQEETSLVAYGKFGVELLVKRSPIFEFEQYGESEIEKLEDYLKKTEKPKLSKLQLLERNYLLTLFLLLILLHCESVNEEIVKLWCSKADIINMKLLFYLFNLEIYGELWQFNGLMKLSSQLKSLNFINKCTDIVELIKLIKITIQNSRYENPITDYGNLVKMLDVNMLRLQLRQTDNSIDVNSFEENSLEDITTIVEETAPGNLELLLSIYQRRRMFREVVHLLKKEKNAKRIIEFLKENAKDLPPEYKTVDLSDDLISVINGTPRLDKHIIKGSLKVLSLSQVDPNELVRRTGNNTTAKVFIIEEIGPRNSDDKEFLINFYMAKLEEALQDGNIWDLFGRFAASYTQDMNYTKCRITDFLLIKLRHNEHCQNFIEYYQNVKNLCMQDESCRLLKSVISQVKAFDVNNMLALLFIPNDAKEEFLAKQDMFRAFLSFNDFLGIEKFVNEETFLDVLRHYNSLPRSPDSLKLTAELLKRNLYCVHDDTVMISLLEEIPCEYSFKTLFGVIFNALKRIDYAKKELELRKALLKDKNTINKTICTSISKQ